MKERNIVRREKVKARDVKEGQTIEVRGSRIRADAISNPSGKVRFRQIGLAGGRRTRSVTVGLEKRVELCLTR